MTEEELLTIVTGPVYGPNALPLFWNENGKVKSDYEIKTYRRDAQVALDKLHGKRFHPNPPAHTPYLPHPDDVKAEREARRAVSDDLLYGIHNKPAIINPNIKPFAYYHEPKKQGKPCWLNRKKTKK